jgi:hypothetical protein
MASKKTGVHSGGRNRPELQQRADVVPAPGRIHDPHRPEFRGRLGFGRGRRLRPGDQRNPPDGTAASLIRTLKSQYGLKGIALCNGLPANGMADAKAAGFDRIYPSRLAHIYYASPSRN